MTQQRVSKATPASADGLIQVALESGTTATLGAFDHLIRTH